MIEFFSPPLLTFPIYGGTLPAGNKSLPREKKIGVRGIERCGGIFLALGRKRYANYAGGRYARFQLTSKYSSDKKKLAITGFFRMAISYPLLSLSRFARKNIIFRPCQKDSSFFLLFLLLHCVISHMIECGKKWGFLSLTCKIFGWYSLSKDASTTRELKGTSWRFESPPPSFFWRTLFSWFFLANVSNRGVCDQLGRESWLRMYRHG